MEGKEMDNRSGQGELGRLLSRKDFLRAATVAGMGIVVTPGLLASPASAKTNAGPVPRSVMREVYEEVKTPYKYGMVVPPPQPNTYTDSASVFFYEDTWYMIYIIYYETGRQGYETLLASSPDLLNWTPLGKILPFRDGYWDSYQAAGYASLQSTAWGGPNTLGQYDGKYWLSYIGGDDAGYEAGDLSIGVANTADPSVAEPWTRFDDPVLTPSDPDTRYWEESKLYKSNVIYDPQKRLGAPYVMYYNAVTRPEPEKIGIALSDDMRNWRRYKTDPVVVEGAAITGDPQVVRMGNVWVMFYFTREDYNRATHTWDDFACSYDLVNWRKWDGEVLLTATEPVDRYYAHKPWVIKHDGVVYHFYTAIGEQGWGIALATSKDFRGTSEAADGLKVSASYTFFYDDPREAVDGRIVYEPEPANRWTAYQSPNISDWLQIEFPEARKLSCLKLHVYDDGGGVQPPVSYDVQFQKGKRWVSAKNQRKSPSAPAARLNTVTFDPAQADGVRVVFDHRDGGVRGNVYSGVTEIEFIT